MATWNTVRRSKSRRTKTRDSTCNTNDTHHVDSCIGHVIREQTVNNVAIPLTRSFSSKPVVAPHDDKLSFKDGIIAAAPAVISHIYDPTFRDTFYDLTFITKPIPDFLLIQRNSTSTALITKMKRELIRVDKISSLTEVQSEAVYRLLSRTLLVVFQTHLNAQDAWRQYTRGRMCNQVILVPGSRSDNRSFREVAEYTKGSGQAPLAVAISPSDEQAYVEGLTLRGTTAGFFLSKFSDNPKVHSVIRSLPYYANVLSPDNFKGIMDTGVLPLFKGQINKDHIVKVRGRILSTPMPAEYSPFLSVSVPSNVFLPRTYEGRSPIGSVFITSFTPPPDIRSAYPDWVDQAFTFVSGTAPIINIVTHDKFQISLASRGANSTFTKSKMHAVHRKMKAVDTIIAIGEKGIGKTSLIPRLKSAGIVEVIDSDDYADELSPDGEVQVLAVLLICQYNKTTPSKTASIVGTLLHEGEVPIEVFKPAQATQVPTSILSHIMATVRAAYVRKGLLLHDHVDEITEIHDAVNLMLSGAVVNPKYTTVIYNKLSSVNGRKMIFCHTDSEYTMLRQTFRQCFGIRIVPGIPRDGHNTIRGRRFAPFQNMLTVYYEGDMLLDTLSKDALVRIVSGLDSVAVS